jgi:hypothetical protein
MGTEAKAAPNFRKQFKDAGFDVVEIGTQPESFEVKKYNCALALGRTADGGWAPSGPPLFSVRGHRCELEDRGYQKFWYATGRRFPVRVTDLRTLHRFDQEVRAILGLKSLYHESLGTTSARSAYDRLSGRPQ